MIFIRWDWLISFLGWDVLVHKRFGLRLKSGTGLQKIETRTQILSKIVTRNCSRLERKLAVCMYCNESHHLLWNPRLSRLDSVGSIYQHLSYQRWRSRGYCGNQDGSRFMEDSVQIRSDQIWFGDAIWCNAFRRATYRYIYIYIYSLCAYVDRCVITREQEDGLIFRRASERHRSESISIIPTATVVQYHRTFRSTCTSTCYARIEQNDDD